MHHERERDVVEQVRAGAAAGQRGERHGGERGVGADHDACRACAELRLDGGPHERPKGRARHAQRRVGGRVSRVVDHGPDEGGGRRLDHVRRAHVDADGLARRANDPCEVTIVDAQVVDEHLVRIDVPPDVGERQVEALERDAQPGRPPRHLEGQALALGARLGVRTLPRGAALDLRRRRDLVGEAGGAPLGGFERPACREILSPRAPREDALRGLRTRDEAAQAQGLGIAGPADARGEPEPVVQPVARRAQEGEALARGERRRTARARPPR